jgi:exonuclease III
MDSILPIKRHRLTDWSCKQDPIFCCIEETHLKDKDRHYLRVKGWKTIFQANDPKKQAGEAILISNKIDFNPKVIRKKIMKDTSYSSKVNYPRCTLNSEHLCSKCKGIHIH